jgi:two-component system chemotaxis sensor kinase CheA
VRDLAAQFGKRVRIEMEGKDTELDKTIIEAIKDPLTHIVRNSIDHGIETPEARRAAGKHEEGVLFLRAYHEGGQVNIEITDDGAGIDLERVKNKAVERGLVSAEQAARMGDREAVNLIFLPGLSTAEKVSNVSGRGVGMDVVRTNIEKIGGTLDMQTRQGNGTTIKVKIPLTLAIVPALIVSSGGDRYAIPQVSLLELVGLDGEQARAGIELVHGAPVYRLRGQILPIVYLNRELDVADIERDGSVTIVVLKADDRQFGLVVDQVNDTEEIVVKPLSPQLKGIGAFSGCTIMGDGQVALILDVLGLAQKAHVVSEVQEQQAVGDGSRSSGEGGKETETLLVLAVGDDGRTAIPLSAVDRLEEFKRTAIEHTAGRDVVQYRNTILPLVDIGATLGYMPSGETGDTIQVVVYSQHGRMVGFVVDRIVDIVEQVATVHQQSDRPGIVGSIVVQSSVTDLLDVHEIIQSVAPWYEQAEVEEAMSNA